MYDYSLFIISNRKDITIYDSDETSINETENCLLSFKLTFDLKTSIKNDEALADYLVWLTDFLPYKGKDSIECICLNTLKNRFYHSQSTYSPNSG